MKRFILLAVSAIILTTANAQDVDSTLSEKREFNIDFQLRPRAEFRNGYGTPRGNSSDPAAFVSNRARLSLGYSALYYDLKASGEHVGTWGNEALQAEDGSFILNEAWGKLHSKDNVWFAKFGRQALSYDDERVLGAADWNQSGNFHDALKLGYEKKYTKVHLILSFNQNEEKIHGNYFDDTNSQSYKSMQTVWFHHDFKKIRLGVSLLAMNLGWQIGDEDDEYGDDYMQTFGTNLTYNIAKFNLAGSFYYQMGRNQNAKDVSAYMWSFSAARPIGSKWSVNAGIDFRSGDDGSDNRYNAFNQLFGSHHKFYGAMDYFTQIFLRGLWNPHAGVSFTPSKVVDLNATYHYFATDVKIYTSEGYMKSLGHEIDLQVNVNILKDVTLQAGYSTVIGTSAMDRVRGGNHSLWQDWGWVSLNLNPQIFKAIF